MTVKTKLEEQEKLEKQKEQRRLKELREVLESKFQKWYGGNFVDLADARKADLSNDLIKEESARFSFVSKSDSMLQEYAKEGWLLLTVPGIIQVGGICTRIKDHFIFTLEHAENIMLKKSFIGPGRYLIKSKPYFLDSGGMLMRNMNMTNYPNVAKVIYAHAVCKILGRNILLIGSSCILCSEVVEGRFGGTRLCFQKNANGQIIIGASTKSSSVSLPVLEA